MPDINWIKLLGAGLVVWGLKLIFFGGTKTVSESYIELFGFRFGRGESEDMGLFECWFIGLALICGGVYVLVHA